MTTQTKLGSKGYNKGRTAPNKGKTYPPEVLTGDEVRRLIAGCSERYPTGQRNRALIAVLYRAGLRISEALDLYPKDVDLERGTVTVLHGKGDKSRTVGLDTETVGMISRWTETRIARGNNGDARLFCTLKGTPLHAAYVRNLLPRLAEKAGIEKRVHPHGLRHSLAAELMMEGIPVPIIQRQLGHASLATTATYLDHISPADVIAVAHERDTWVT